MVPVLCEIRSLSTEDDCTRFCSSADKNRACVPTDKVPISFFREIQRWYIKVSLPEIQTLLYYSLSNYRSLRYSTV